MVVGFRVDGDAVRYRAASGEDLGAGAVRIHLEHAAPGDIEDEQAARDRLSFQWLRDSASGPTFPSSAAGRARVPPCGVRHRTLRCFAEVCVESAARHIPRIGGSTLCCSGEAAPETAAFARLALLRRPPLTFHTRKGIRLRFQAFPLAAV